MLTVMSREINPSVFPPSNILTFRALIFHSECGELSNEIKKHKKIISWMLIKYKQINKKQTKICWFIFVGDLPLLLLGFINGYWIDDITLEPVFKYQKHHGFIIYVVAHCLCTLFLLVFWFDCCCLSR